MQYNEDQLRELIRCRNDIEYFADTYIKVTKTTGVVQLTLNDFQRGVVRDLAQRSVLFTPGRRQDGKTTVAAIILLHKALFNEYQVSVVLAPKKAMSNHVLELIVEMYDRLPEFLQTAKLTTRNKTTIHFDNMCSVMSVGSDVDLCRGRTITTVYIDESEWFDRLDDVINCMLPAMSSTQKSKMFCLSSTFTQDKMRQYGLEAV